MHYSVSTHLPLGFKMYHLGPLTLAERDLFQNPHFGIVAFGLGFVV